MCGAASWHFIIWISAQFDTINYPPDCRAAAHSRDQRVCPHGDLWLPGNIFLVSAHVTQLGSTTKICFYTYLISWQKKRVTTTSFLLIVVQLLYDRLCWWLFSRVCWINYNFKIVNYQPIIIFLKSCVITNFLSPACAASLSAWAGSFSEGLD